MTKKLRQEIFEKYGGLCAYTGKPLGHDWQVDHVEPSKHFDWGLKQGEANAIDNLVPCLRRINHYKRCKNLETWRQFISTLHIRLKKLPNKTRVQRTEKRKEYLLDVAAAFDITVDKPFNGLFYFETLTAEPLFDQPKTEQGKLL